MVWFLVVDVDIGRVAGMVAAVAVVAHVHVDPGVVLLYLHLGDTLEISSFLYS